MKTTIRECWKSFLDNAVLRLEFDRDRRETHGPGATVRWPVPPKTAMVLRVKSE